MKGKLYTSAREAGACTYWPDDIESPSFDPEFNSTEIDNNDLRLRNRDKQRVSTLREIRIDSREEYENADDFIRFNSEFDWNEIDESLDNQKRNESRISNTWEISISYNR
jgi:hypothetical protein